jgi:hypothetical protein
MITVSLTTKRPLTKFSWFLSDICVLCFVFCFRDLIGDSLNQSIRWESIFFLSDKAGAAVPRTRATDLRD